MNNSAAIALMFKAARSGVTISFIELKFRSHSLVDIGFRIRLRIRVRVGFRVVLGLNLVQLGCPVPSHYQIKIRAYIKNYKLLNCS